MGFSSADFDNCCTATSLFEAFKMITETGHPVPRATPPPVDVLQSTRLLVRRLEAIAAQHDDQDDVVAVCQKWTRRIAQLERDAIEAGLQDSHASRRH